MSLIEILKEDFVQYALFGSLLIGVLCSILGVYVILKRIVFLGIAVSEVSALGVAIGLFMGISPSLTSLLLTMLAVLVFWIPVKEGSISKESIIGFTYVVAAALSVKLIAKNPLAESRGLDLVSGNLLYIQKGDIVVLAVVTVAVALLQVFFFKKFIFVSFDPETANTMGIRSSLYDFLVYLSLGLSVAISMKVGGVLFVFGFLVVPALFGFLIFRRIPLILLGAVVFSVVSSFFGLLVSVRFDWPTSPTILTFAGALFVAAVLIKSVSGALWHD